MRLGCANIKNFPDMTPAQVGDDGKTMGLLCDIWGHQENNPGEDDPVVAKALGKDWAGVHMNTDLPVWFKKETYKVVGARVQGMPFDPRLPLTPVPRLMTGTTFRIIGRDGVPPFVIVNLHFIAGGMNGPEEKPRIRQWNIEMTYLKAFVADYKRKGFTVFVLGDFNHPRPPKPTTNFVWLVGNRLDRIGVTLTGSVAVDEISDGVVDLNSDHHGQWTRVLLSSSRRSLRSL
jgi:hypothetical protein